MITNHKMARIIINIPKTLSGISLNIPYIGKKYYSGTMCFGVMPGSACM